jgi:hypothetical protein
MGISNNRIPKFSIEYRVKSLKLLNIDCTDDSFVLNLFLKIYTLLFKNSENNGRRPKEGLADIRTTAASRKHMHRSSEQ